MKRTLEVIECDICGADAIRYLVSFPEGQKILDRCGQHDARIMVLRDEKGDWAKKPKPGRSKFSLTSPEEISKLPRK